MTTLSDGGRASVESRLDAAQPVLPPGQLELERLALLDQCLGERRLRAHTNRQWEWRRADEQCSSVERAHLVVLGELLVLALERTRQVLEVAARLPRQCVALVSLACGRLLDELCAQTLELLRLSSHMRVYCTRTCTVH